MTNTVGCRQAKSDRISSLDQFRGYTVVGMLLVNYFGGFATCPQVLKHTNDYCSYADTIMPQFLFAVGFALRLSFGRRMQSEGSVAAYARMVRRLLGLVLVAILVYQVSPRATNWEKFSSGGVWESISRALSGPLKREWFQTLMHIAVTSLWILPVLHCRPAIRFFWMMGSGLLHVFLSYWFYFEWVNAPPSGIDGGPLGFLTWTIPAIVGTIACDAFVGLESKQKLRRNLAFAMGASTLLMLGGYAVSCGTRLYDVPTESVEILKESRLANDPVLPSWERIQSKSGGGMDWLAEPPFFKPPASESRKWNYWMMSQRAGTLSYLIFSAGFSLMLFCLFFVVCDLGGLKFSVFRTFGTNALAAYILHEVVAEAIKPFVPKDSPAWYAYISLVLYFFINWFCIRQLELRNAYFRV